jgi:oxygen-independent coproporphyrinogen III oxidase
MTSTSRSQLEENARLMADDLRRTEPYGLVRTRTGYYYIAHYFPLKAMRDMPAIQVRQLLDRLRGGTFETYVHFPFCEVRCSFCHFHKELVGKDFASREQTYFDLVSRELALYHDVLGRIRARSFYMGGGTPSLASNTQLKQFLDLVDSQFEFPSDAEIKFEVFPRLYSDADLFPKLSILRSFGVTDLVVDLESGSQRALSEVGRRLSSLDAYETVVNKAVSQGFSSIVTALVLGLPHETIDSLEQTLERLCSIPEVQVINTFPLIIRKPDAIHRKLTRHPEVFGSAHDRDVLWLFARNFLRSRGFTEGPISYMRRPGKRPAQQADKFECVDLLGLGTSAFGYWNSGDVAAQHFNHCNSADYAKRINAGELPVWRAGVLDNTERARRKLIFGLANCKTENLFDLEDRFSVSVDLLLGKTLNALLSLGLIRIEPGRGISYTDAGLCRLEEISFFLGSERVINDCDKPIPRDRFKREVQSHNYYIRIPKRHRRRFDSFVASQSADFMSKVRLPEQAWHVRSNRLIEAELVGTL